MALVLGCRLRSILLASTCFTQRYHFSPPHLHGPISPRNLSLCNSSRTSRTYALQNSSNMDPIVTTDWLSHRLSDVCILDVRGNVVTKLVEQGVEKSEYVTCYDDYLEGHIPGAVFFNWVKDGIDCSSNIPTQLITDNEEFTMLMEGKGISTEKHVVVYDCGDGLLAPRIWWALIMHGHPSVFVLDGGWKKWTEEGREIEITAPCPLKIYAKYEPIDDEFNPWISSEELLNTMLQEKDGNWGTPREGCLKVIDARSQEQYNGIIRRAKYGGRIPGAINLPRKLFLQPTGVYKSVEEQRKIFVDAGLNPKQPTRLVAYCNGGVASCTILLAWVRVGGLGSWANYDGSWNEWGNSDSLPRES